MERTLNVNIDASDIRRALPGKAMGRKTRWSWVVGALLLVVVAAAFFRWSSQDLIAAKQALAETQQLLAEARQEEAQAFEAARRAQLANGLMRHAAEQGLAHSAWAERRFNVKQATMSRAAANALLSEVVSSPNRLFGAEQFELSVMRRSESLFAEVKDPESKVQVTVRGSLLFRTTGGGS